MTSKFPLAGASKQLLEKNAQFLTSVQQLNRAFGLRFDGNDPEATTEIQALPNGDFQVTLTLPLDDNRNAADGRIYLRDQFVFDAREEVLKGYKRSFSAQMPGSAKKLWEDRLKKYESQGKPFSKEEERSNYEAFALNLARSAARPFDKSLIQGLRSQKSYLRAALQTLNAVQPDWTLKVADPQAYYVAHEREGYYEVRLAIPLDNDERPDNGRLFLIDKFLIDRKSLGLVKFERQWRAAPEIGEALKPSATMWVDRLQATQPPTLQQAESFVQALLPALFPQRDLSMLGRAAREYPLPADWISPWENKASEARERTQRLVKATQEGLDIIQSACFEWLEQKSEAAKGWLNGIFGDSVKSVQARSEALKNVFAKAQTALQQGARSPFEALQRLDLSGEEKETRDALLENAVLQKINSVSQSLGENRGWQWVHLIRTELLQEAGLARTAHNILVRMGLSLQDKNYSDLKNEVDGLQNALEGQASLIRDPDLVVPKLTEEWFNPASMAAMIGAPFVGALGEGLILTRAPRWWGLRTLAQGVGLFGEAAGFTTIHKGLASAVHDPEQVWQNWSKEFASTATLFAFLRLSHAASAWTSDALFRNKFAGQGFEPGLLKTPFERTLLLNPSSVVTSPWGKLASGFLMNGSGFLGTAMALKASEAFELRAQSGGGGGIFGEALMAYVQAMIGFKVANGATGGKLQSAMAKWRLMWDSYDPYAKRATAKPSGETPPGPATQYGAAQHEISRMWRTYKEALVQLYGPQTGQAVSEPLARLFNVFPDLEDPFNPRTLKIAGETNAQQELFNHFRDLIHAHSKLPKEGTIRDQILADLDKVLEARRSWETAPDSDVLQVKNEYTLEVRSLFGNKMMTGSRIFANLYKNNPALKSSFNPRLVYADPNRDAGKQFGWFADQHLKALTDENVKSASWGQVLQLTKLISDQAPRLESEGWGPLSDKVRGVRAWELSGDKNYLGGRNDLAAIHLADPVISDTHFQIKRNKGKWFIQDLGSSNGTWVGPNRLNPHDAVELENQAVIRAGSSNYRFEILPGENAALYWVSERSDVPQGAEGGSRTPKGTVINPPSPQPAPEPTAGEYIKTIPVARLQDLRAKYRENLADLFGGPDTSATHAAGAYIFRILENFPDLEAEFNPKKLKEVSSDLKTQKDFFDKLEKAIRGHARYAEANVKERVEMDLKDLMNVQKPWEAATAEEIRQVQEKYGPELQELFGPRQRKAAEIFAGIYKNAPELEAKFDPKKIKEMNDSIDLKDEADPQVRKDKYEAEVARFFSRKLKALLHSDRQPLHRKDIADFASKEGSKLEADLKAERERLAFGGAPYVAAAEGVGSAGGLQQWDLQANQNYVVGRAANCEIPVADNGVSSSHFSIYFDPNTRAWMVRDLGSTNGTFVQGQKLGSRFPGCRTAMIIRHGDLIQAGGSLFKFSQEGTGARLKLLPPEDMRAQTSDPPPGPHSQANGMPSFQNQTFKVGHARVVQIRGNGGNGGIHHEPDPVGDGVRYVLSIPKPNRGLKALFSEDLPRDLAEILLRDGRYILLNPSGVEIKVVRAGSVDVDLKQKNSATFIQDGDQITIGKFSFVFKI